MSYDANTQVDFSFAGLTLGSAAQTKYLRVPYSLGNPRGKNTTAIRFARIREVALSVTTTINGTTSLPVINIGTAGSIAKYCALTVGTGTALAAPAAWGLIDADGLVTAFKDRIDLLNDGDAVGTLQGFLNFNTVIAVGTPAGVADCTVSVQWW